MRECDDSKIHISNNSLLSICLLIMLDTLLLVPSVHCNTLLHLTTLHQTTIHYTYRHFTSSHLHFTKISLSFVGFKISPSSTLKCTDSMVLGNALKECTNPLRDTSKLSLQRSRKSGKA